MPEFRSACILNVDDSQVSRQAITRMLEEAGFRVVEAATGEDALARAVSDAPDLILLDIELPDIRGTDVCRRLKSDPATHSIPILHLSATHVSDADRAFGLDTGADGYLVHPVDPGVLTATIRALLRMRAAVERVHRLHAVTAELSTALTPPQVAQIVLFHGARALGAEAGALALLAPDGTALEVTGSIGGSDWLAMLGVASNHRIPIETPFPLTVCAWTGEPVWIESAEAYHASYPHLAPPPAPPRDASSLNGTPPAARRPEPPSARGRRAPEALACVPMTTDGRVLGALGFTLRRPRRFSETERLFVLALALHGAQALERARLFKLEQKARTDAERAMAHEREARQEAEIASAQFEAVLQHMPAGLAVADAVTGALLFANKQLQSIWREPLTPGEPLPQRDGYRSDGTPYADGDWPLSRSLRGEVVRGEEIRIRRRDGTWVVARTSSAPITDGAGRTLRAIAVVDDVTEAKRTEEALRRNVRAREDLLAIVSHDLRNPLNLVTMGAAMIQRRAPEGGEGDWIRKQADRVLRAAERMNLLIRDLLDAASIESGRFTLERRPQPMAPLVVEALDAVSPLAAAKSIELERDLADVLADCDRERIIQVLVNLLTNAVKFTPDYGLVRVTAAPRSGQVIVSVTDTGPGVSTDQLQHLFDRYVGASRTAGGGTGLGLYIAKGIVDAHGGTIWVDSRPGLGSTFSFLLPQPSA